MKILVVQDILAITASTVSSIATIQYLLARTHSTDPLITSQAMPCLEVMRNTLHQLGNAKPSTPI